MVAQAILEWRGTGVRRRKILSTLELRFVIDNAITCTFHAPLVLIIIACSNTLPTPHGTCSGTGQTGCAQNSSKLNKERLQGVLA